MTTMLVVGRSPVYLQAQSPVVWWRSAPPPLQLPTPPNPGGGPSPYLALRRSRKRALASPVHSPGSGSTRRLNPVPGGGGTL